ncbi:PH domain-containing protein [Sporichthya polymorpha]|uniref:PH domain-containing protein n=1 Tax=Sporichthya polymorpha TaxID=35751 RepID=UPI0003669468|nr:PH domain-containing protein [Sporichthya polymorpha]
MTEFHPPDPAYAPAGFPPPPEPPPDPTSLPVDPPEEPRLAARLHPLTPFARGWAAMIGATVVAGQDAVREADVVQILLILAAVTVAALAFGFWTWWFTRYVIEGDDLRVDSGLLFRKSRHIRLSRLQAIDVVQPLVARILGLAELRLEVAGGGAAEGRLAYLSEDKARTLRAELLARAAGVRPDAPEAPEQVLVRVPVAALMTSLLLTVWVPLLVVGGSVLIGVAIWQREPALIFPAIPVLLAFGTLAWRELESGFDFTVAESPDGLRLRHGLLARHSQTVPPGRVQALRIIQPLFWRNRDWVRVLINVAGYAGGNDAAQKSTSVLLPVAPRATALAVIGRILPGVDPGTIPLNPAPRRAGRARPFWWRGLAWGADDRVFVATSGLFRRNLDVVPHGKTQSVRLTQGPWQRRLGLATVRLDSVPGPVVVEVAHRDAAEARELAETQAARAREGRRSAGPERWMAGT